MKRAALGGAHRGPVAPTRQRRTIRFIQVLLVVFGVGLLVFAVMSFLDTIGYEPVRTIDAPREPSLVQPIVLTVVGAIFFGGGLLLGGRTVRVPTPARLEELVGRAESVALEKAAEASREDPAAAGAPRSTGT